MKLKFFSMQSKTCLFTLQLKLIAPKFIISERRISTFKQLISDYSALTLNPKKALANVGTPGLMPGQIQAWAVGLQFPAVSRHWHHWHTAGEC